MQRILQLCLFISLISQVSSCQTDFFIQFNGLCMDSGSYQSAASNEYYPIAKAHCTKFEATLPMFKTQSDNHWFAESWYHNIFIGLECNMTTHQYMWQDGTPIAFTNFADGSTSTFCNSTQHFMMVAFDGTWAPLADNDDDNPVFAHCVEPVRNLSDSCHDYDHIPTENGQASTCFSFNEEVDSWENAEVACQTDGAHLISIHSKTQNDFLRRHSLGHGYTDSVHIGLQAPAESQNISINQCTWTDNSQSDYSQLSPSLDADKNCFVMDTSRTQQNWFTTNCKTTKLPYFCGRPVLAPVTPTPPTCPPKNKRYKEGDVITSPGYPYGFPADLKCEYKIQVTNANMSAQIEVVFFETNFCCDHLKIYDYAQGDILLKELLGANESGVKVTATDNVMRLEWEPSMGVGVRGWKVKVNVVKKPWL